MAEQKEANAVGRPPKPAHLKRTNRLVLLLTDDEQVALDKFVSDNLYADRSDFARDLILEAIGYERSNAPHQ